MHIVSLPPADRPPNAIALGPRAWVRPPDLRFTYSRSGGPGGQNVNKIESRAQLRVALADIAGIDDAARARIARLAGSHLVGADAPTEGSPPAAEAELLFACDEHRSQRANHDLCIDRLRLLVLQGAIPPKRRRETKPTRASRERRLETKRIQSQRKRMRGDAG
ncbi:MAG: aminoacyl-tRNA hydrolase [Planctomycetes bacterium]|nr:aminoacyl-tRNA hydrolase [Planctomycetota bacterium]